MLLYLTIGFIFLLGPLSQHKVAGDIYANYGDIYLEESGSGDDPETETDLTYLDHEGSGHGKPGNGPYEATYDTYDDEEGLDDDIYTDDVDPMEDELPPFEGSGNGGTLFIDAEEEEEVEVERDIEISETIIVEERPKVESPNTTPPPTLTDHSEMDNSIQILNTKSDERQVSIFAQPGILAAFIGGAVVGLLCAILLVMFIVYRMRKKDEGSYPLDEPKRMPLTSSYSPNDKEIYA